MPLWNESVGNLMPSRAPEPRMVKPLLMQKFKRVVGAAAHEHGQHTSDEDDEMDEEEEEDGGHAIRRAAKQTKRAIPRARSPEAEVSDSEDEALRLRGTHRYVPSWIQ
jgi:hypothetical protein